jgi:hypothetical protein
MILKVWEYCGWVWKAVVFSGYIVVVVWKGWKVLGRLIGCLIGSGVGYGKAVWNFLMGFHLKSDFKGVGILWMGVEGSGIQWLCYYYDVEGMGRQLKLIAVGGGFWEGGFWNFWWGLAGKSVNSGLGFR